MIPPVCRGVVAAVCLAVSGGPSVRQAPAQPPTRAAVRGLVGPPAPAVVDSVVLERSPCIVGECPAYRVRVARGGRVHFTSSARGDTAADGTPRTAAARVAPDAVAALARRARAAGLWALPAEPGGDPRLCPHRIPDAPSTTTTAYWRGGATRVHDYLGCLEPSLRAGPPALERFRALAEAIDSLAGVDRWIRGPGPAR